MKRTPRRPPAVLVLLVPALMLVVPSVLAQDSEKFQEVLSRAEQGHAVAQFNLGLKYAKGEGVPENDAEAVKWYRKAAEQGNAVAQGQLGFMYAQGKGVPEDYVLAYAWLNLAAAQGIKNARETKDVLRPRMTPEQVARAQELSATLFKRINESQ